MSTTSPATVKRREETTKRNPRNTLWEWILEVAETARKNTFLRTKKKHQGEIERTLGMGSKGRN